MRNIVALFMAITMLLCSGAGAGFVASEDDVAIAVGLKKGSELVDDINAVVNGIKQGFATSR